jgi:hypothetical protein
LQRRQQAARDVGGGTIWDLEIGNIGDWATAREDRTEKVREEQVEERPRAVQADLVAAWNGAHGDYVRVWTGERLERSGPQVGTRREAVCPRL